MKDALLAVAFFSILTAIFYPEWWGRWAGTMLAAFHAAGGTP
jgi:hypothetical protein